MAVNKTSDVVVQCTRCRNQHAKSDRLPTSLGDGRTAWVCPRCRGRAYYDMTPQAAWCWASGLIELGDVDQVPGGAILVATGPKAFLVGTISAVARIGRGASEGLFLVPGVPEAPNEAAKGDALETWLAWCAGGNGGRHRKGVTFATPAA